MKNNYTTQPGFKKNTRKQDYIVDNYYILVTWLNEVDERLLQLHTLLHHNNIYMRNENDEIINNHNGITRAQECQEMASIDLTAIRAPGREGRHSDDRYDLVSLVSREDFSRELVAVAQIERLVKSLQAKTEELNSKSKHVKHLYDELYLSQYQKEELLRISKELIKENEYFETHVREIRISAEYVRLEMKYYQLLHQQDKG